MDTLISKSISILLAVGLGCELATSHPNPNLAQSTAQQAASLQSRLVDRCCQVGRERAIESARFNCKLSAREALVTSSQATSDRASQLLALNADSLLSREPNFADQCEMVLESCCLAHHRTRNCNSGKQFAKSGSACMDVELSKEATVATESFNDCCMSCSLGILAARTPTNLNETTSSNGGRLSAMALADRCKLISPLASSLSGQLYEQTYDECCQENLPRPSSALNFETGARVDCSQAANVCSQRCLPAGSQDFTTRRLIEQDKCDCFTGFKLASDGVSCLDVDECKLNLHTCNRHSEVCDNTRGSFRCLARAHQPQGRSLHLANDDQQANDGASLALLGGGEQQQFASMRLCPPGSRWLANEARCSNDPQASWKRNAATFSSSASISSSSRRSVRSN